MANPFSITTLFLFVFSTLFSSSLSQSKISGLLIDCGSSAAYTDNNGLRWVPDDPYITSGTPRNLSTKGLLTTFSTLRSFPFPSNSTQGRKFCYILPSYRGSRYLIRTSYFFDGPGSPPVFDQIVDATLWTKVNTSADYLVGSGSYYEAVFLARGKSISICVGGNPNYTKGDPFINSIEFIMLSDSVYNATNFDSKSMALIARNKFGAAGSIERYPNDMFNRYWHPYADKKHAISSTHNVTTSSFWNLPPSDIFNTALTSEKDKILSFQWPQQVPLSNSTYYIALYFADSLPNSSRNQSVYFNGYKFFDGSVSSAGSVVFSSDWILSGLTTLTLSPTSGSSSSLPPLINAGEVFGLFNLNNLTYTRDVVSLEAIKNIIGNIPVDWRGDPCMPVGYSWSGVTCVDGPRIRVVSLNLSSMGLTGMISPSIANLTALTDISFANNNITGSIPDLSQLKNLRKLDLQNNQLTESIPQSLGNISSLIELFLQNNNLTGQVPSNLLDKGKLNLNLRLHPGNQFSPDPAVP